jgi:hypothetical protein
MDAIKMAADVSEVAEGFGIPLPGRAIFCADLTKQIEGAGRAGRGWRRSQPYAWLAPIAEQAAALRDGLSGLGVDERRELEKLILIGARDTSNNVLLTVSTVRAFYGALDAIAECGAELVARGDALSASQPSRPPGTPGPRKKPLPFTPGASAPEELVAALYELIARHNGKRPTFGWDAIEEKPVGTLVSALELLRPHLPDGFLDSLTPKVLRNLIGALP